MFTIEHPASWEVRRSAFQPQPQQTLGSTSGRQRFVTGVMSDVTLLGPLDHWRVSVRVTDKAIASPVDIPAANTMIHDVPAYCEMEGRGAQQHWILETYPTGFELFANRPRYFDSHHFPYHQYGLPAPSEHEIHLLDSLLERMIQSFRPGPAASRE
jgi:hypothetical protein